MCLVLTFFMVKYIIEKREEQSSRTLTLSVGVIIFVSLFTLILCVIIGFGGMYGNCYDYDKHRCIITDMVNNEWPVMYTAHTPAMLTYYIGHYILPALVGKLFDSIKRAEQVMGIISYAGVLLLYLNVIFYTKASSWKKQIIVLLIFLFFSGLYMPLQYIYYLIMPEQVHALGDPQSFFIGDYRLQIRPILFALQYVFPQYLVPTICACMFLQDETQPKYWGLIILSSFICGIFGFLCLVVLAVCIFIINCIKEKQFDINIFSISNIISVVVGVVILLYYIGNITSEKPDFCHIRFMNELRYYYISYIPFLIFMVYLYAVLIYPENKQSTIYWATLIVLTFIPLFKMGRFNDWVSSGTLVAYFMLMLLCAKFIIEDCEKRGVQEVNINYLASNSRRIRRIVLTILLVIASYSPIKDIALCFPLEYTDYPTYRSLTDYTDVDNPCSDQALTFNYYTYYPDKSIFYKYIARR